MRDSTVQIKVGYVTAPPHITSIAESLTSHASHFADRPFVSRCHTNSMDWIQRINGMELNGTLALGVVGKTSPPFYAYSALAVAETHT